MSVLRRIKETLSPKREVYLDPVFGRLWRERKGWWNAVVPFEHAPTGTTTLELTIDSGKEHPTALQQALYQEIVARYDTLWPQIAEALTHCHKEFKTIESIEQNIEEPSLHLPPLQEGKPRIWALDYTFDLDTASGSDKGYYAEFREWELHHVGAGD